MLSNRRTRASSIRTVEWLRDNGARGLVNQVENIYYSLNAPATGGPALHALPKQAGRRRAARRRAARGHADLPPAAASAR